jgi:tetratricopeptide (TPR) repeat protein
VAYTPSLYVLDPATERATATHLGGMTVPELNRFLDRAAPGAASKADKPAAAALARGDELLGRGRYGEAPAAFRDALRLAPRAWPERPRAVSALAWALWLHGDCRACAETATAEASTMPRGPEFARLVLAGLSSATQGGDAPWAQAARTALEKLGAEAVALPTALRDHRFQLYQHLMMAAKMRGDTVTAARWSHGWLDEIDAISPKDDDERSALDIARVDAASDTEGYERVIPALTASEKAMPGNYNASLRLAQMQIAAKRYDEALAACDRGLAYVTGPVGRTWLLRTEADALIAKGDPAKARKALDLALQSAQAIGNKSNRENNVRRTTQAIAALDKKGK